MNIDERIGRLENWLNQIDATLDRPIWNGEAFVYKQMTMKHVAYLKAIRAISSLHALPLLYGHGLSIDGGTIVRCINEALTEIFFVLEKYPETTSKVEQFVRHFMADTKTDEKVAPVLSRKIHSAQARFSEDTLNPNDALKMVRNVYETFSGYVHSQCPHIMEIYGGPPHDQKFRTGGVLNPVRIQANAQIVEATVESTEIALAFMAYKLGLYDLFHEVVNRRTTQD